MYDDPIETEHYKGYAIELYPDDNPDNPRDWDNLGTMVCSHRNYNLGDDDYKDTIRWMLSDCGYVDLKELLQTIERNEGPVFYLPVYMYEHSGVALSTGGFNDPFDSGMVGIIYVSKAKVREEWGCKHISPKIKDIVISNLKAEVETYSMYLNGEVYGYQVKPLDEDGEVIDDDLDSCWGYYGWDEAEQAGREYIDWKIKEDEEQGWKAVPVEAEVC